MVFLSSSRHTKTTAARLSQLPKLPLFEYFSIWMTSEYADFYPED
jgi:hypothetical protein